MSNHEIHLYAPVNGGVEDYVDVCLMNDSQSRKLGVVKQTGYQKSLPAQCLLHYSGYGYSKRGAPLWLLNKVQTDRPGIKTFGVFFHELYASGPLWGSAFWLSPVQKHIACRLAKLSDFWITNREGSAQWLRPFAGDKPHAVLPVFSNVGEMPAYSSVRLPKVVVFGSQALRVATYRAAGNALFAWAHAKSLEIHDIGPAINDRAIFKSLQDACVVQHGRLSVADVSTQLANASFGIIAYPIDYVAKSGVFAAYCSHGICPILISEKFTNADGLLKGINYFSELNFDVELDINFKKIGNAAWQWYQSHNVITHVSTIKRLLDEASTVC